MFKNVVMAIDLDDEATWKTALAKAIGVAAGGSLVGHHPAGFDAGRLPANGLGCGDP